VERLLERALSWTPAGIDIAVANAGRGVGGGLLTSDVSGWEETVRLNVLGAAHLMRLAARHMVERGAGDIVVLGSAAGRNVSSYAGFYAATKSAVTALAEALRREVCAHGVRVSVVMPGLVRTEFQRTAQYGDDFFRRAAGWGKLLDPELIGDAVVWLLGLPPHANVSELLVRPTGQDYP